MRHNAGEADFSPVHDPVLCAEIVALARETRIDRGGIFVDATLGEGGHSALILASFPAARVIGIERDPEILVRARERLHGAAGRIEFINDNFANIAGALGAHRGKIAAVLYDFGISSFHYDASGRGFSFRDHEPLDMRLDGARGESAADIVNARPERELADIFRVYGEERWAKKIARRIVERREDGRIETSLALAELVLGAIPRRFHVKNIHPATRVFQALRIIVNDELSAIERSLADALDLIEPGGRIIAISFHSLEDRIVKTMFRARAKVPYGEEPSFRLITKKPIVPGDDEVARNRRARSAKLRCIERLAS